MMKLISVLVLLISIIGNAKAQFEEYKDHYVQNRDVKLHYVSRGEGDVMIFLHGFPDFWFTWKYQMDALSKDYKVIGLDLRAYNLSEGPEGADNYQMKLLMDDLVTLIDAVTNKPVTLVANDWGGAIAWRVATFYPAKVKALIACNIPHPTLIANHVSKTPETSDYTKSFNSDNALEIWTPEALTELSQAAGTDMEQAYLEAFKRSNIQGMLDYYRASYPTGGNSNPGNQPPAVQPVKCPVLAIHGLKDQALPAAMLNNQWELVPEGMTLHTIPSAGHFVQREAPELVLKYIRSWLLLQEDK